MSQQPKSDSTDAKPARKKVLVSGCYDLFHSGHVRFFEEASQLGDLYVCVGRDANIEALKHHKTMFPEQERLYMVQNIKHVYHARLSSGMGDTDFEPDLDEIKPDIFFVNEDGDREGKRKVIQKRAYIQYVVAKREPQKGLKRRSSTQLKVDLKDIKVSKPKPEQKQPTQTALIPKDFRDDIIEKLNEIKQDVMELEQKAAMQESKASESKSTDEDWPWRLCMAGGWLDQPWVSKVMRGGVIVMNVDYNAAFKERSGLGTSTRNVAMKIWPTGPPKGMDNIEMAKILFGAENPPGTKYVSGSQDHLGLFLPGVNRLDYKGDFWPYYIVKMDGEAKQRGKSIRDIYRFIEKMLWLIPMNERIKNYDPLIKKDLTVDNVEKLADASDKVWRAMLNCDAENFGIGLTETLKAWKLILPNTVPKELDPIWQKYDKENYGCLFSGCGGGFLMVVANKKPADAAFQITICKDDWWRTKTI